MPIGLYLGSVSCVCEDKTRRLYDHCKKTTTPMQAQIQTAPPRPSNSSQMASSCCKPLPPIALFLGLLLLAPISIASSAPTANNTLQPIKELLKIRRMRAHVRAINKPSVKTIQSPDGDLIDCVQSHLQPAFDHANLKGQKQKLLDQLPQRPDGYRPADAPNTFQLWTSSGESCPEGTIPIRRTTEEDILRASSIRKFGRKVVRRDTSGGGHEHAVGYAAGQQYYGAKASLNVWAPSVSSSSEFSLSQLWVISGSFGNDLNTIEAGWQVSPQLYGDNYPRFFTYWTSDAYQETGCYNLLCSGFVQTNNKIAIGAAISPTSIYNGGQFDVSLLVWKDPHHGHWWLEYGSGVLVGYWPSFLFNHLAEKASMIQFGGEIVNTQSSGLHTSTQMGSGHFAGEGFGKAAYFRNLQMVDWDNNLIPIPNLKLLADHPNCYSIQGGANKVWGNYFYYGGPGRNMGCS